MLALTLRATQACETSNQSPTVEKCARGGGEACASRGSTSGTRGAWLELMERWLAMGRERLCSLPVSAGRLWHGAPRLPITQNAAPIASSIPSSWPLARRDPDGAGSRGRLLRPAQDQAGGLPGARSARRQHLGGSPGRLWVDVSRHLERAAEAATRRAVAVALAAHVPIVASNDVRHARPEGRALLDAFVCLRWKTSLERAGRRLAINAERHLRPRELGELLGGSAGLLCQAGVDPTAPRIASLLDLVPACHAIWASTAAAW